MSIHRRNSVLARAAAATLYHATEDDKGGGGGDAKRDADKGDKDKGRDDSSILKEFQAMKDELQSLRDELKESKRGGGKKRRQADEDDDADDADEDAEQDEDELSKARVAAATAKQEASDATRRALVAEIGVQLRDHLTEKYKEFVGNAKDIILHIEKDLPGDNPKPAEIQRLIADHSRAFVERIKNVRGAHGAPAGGTRRPLTPPGGTEDRELKPAGAARGAEAPRRFSTINWHG